MARIAYSASTVFGKLTSEAIDKIIEAKDLLDRIYAAADVARSGSPVDYTKLEGGDFGVAAGQGEDFWNLLGSVRTEMAGITDTFLASLDNGG